MYNEETNHMSPEKLSDNLTTKHQSCKTNTRNNATRDTRRSHTPRTQNFHTELHKINTGEASAVDQYLSIPGQGV